MAGEGWIKLHRSIRKHWIWEDAQKLKWWLDILLQANHQDSKVLLGERLIIIERGSFHTSEIKLAERWNVNRKTVRKFLDLLQKDNMIFIEKSRQMGTTIKISNYEGYQGFSDEAMDIKSDNGVDNNRDNAMDNGGDINKNDKNDKELKNDKYIYSSDSNEYRLAVYLFNYIKRNNEKAKEPNFQKWAKQMHYILDIDKRDLEEVKQVIKFSQTDPFWYKNILSPDKLRKKYDQLYLQMKNPIKPKGGKVDNFNNYEQRQYDYDELEKKLLGWE